MKNGEWESYAGRLGWAMRRAGRTNQSELARAVGVKPQAIQYLCDLDAGAQGSSHTPSLAKELGVRADWLARGDGPPLEKAVPVAAESVHGGDDEPHVRVPVHGVVHLREDGRQVSQRVGSPKTQPTEGGTLGLPWMAEHCHAMRVQGQGLAPYAQDGYFLVVSAHAPLQPEDFVLVTLRKGGVRLCRLLLDRVDSMVVSPWQGGPAEVLLPKDVVSVALVVCAVSPRWWQADGAAAERPVTG
ncbi:MAG: hypothetical protein KKD97_00075 [Gammaproteobacteria bacterium]|jgi:hypothetical protein|nr:hypothetical protein [Gammaproteobacteria bacterium]